MPNTRAEEVFSVLAIAALVLASCAPPVPTTRATEASLGQPVALSPTPIVTSATLEPASGQPRYGGILSIAHQEDPTTLDLVQESTYVANPVLQCGYNGLAQFDTNNPDEIISDLARSWEVSKDGLTYTFRLHEDIKFHDGTSLTAEDVRYSFVRQMDPPKGVRSPRRALLEPVAKVDVPDSATVKFVLKHPFSPLLGVMACGWMAVYSKAFLEKKGDMKRDVMGTGPYRLRTYLAGSALEYVKNPNYFVKGRPYLDGITFYMVSDPATRLAAFRTGRVKLTEATPAGLTATQAEGIRKTMPDAVLMEYSPLSRAEYAVQAERKPWNDVRVRKAAHLAIDRQKAIQVLEQGYAELGSHMPGKWGLPKEELATIPGYRQPKSADIAEAKRLLGEAGYSNGFQTKVTLRAEKVQEELSTYLADQLALVGIKLELHPVDRAMQVQIQITGDFEMYVRSTSLSFSDPHDVVRYWSRPVGEDWGQNINRLKNEEIWELFDRQSRVLDPAERTAVVRELDRRLIEQGAEPILYWRKGIIGMWPEVKNRGKVVGTFTMNTYQDIWLAK